MLLKHKTLSKEFSIDGSVKGCVREPILFKFAINRPPGIEVFL